MIAVSKVLAARRTNVITARACNLKRSARTLANARKDHSIRLEFAAIATRTTHNLVR